MSPDRGTAVVEFAVVVPMVLLVLLATVEVALVARTQLEVLQASREGAREAAASPDPERAVAAVRATLGRRLGSAARISVKRPQIVGERAEVSVAVPHRVASPLLGGFTVEVRATAVMRVER